ncbi:putative protein phosphatase 2C 25 [Silene latifolia]|uniref:putative protein phosphatase 2C 25 n=1 Tax=Silene latifolia TaxID=37657 RepID=UPI003D770B3C
MSVAVSNSPVFSPSHHHYHHNNSIFSSPSSISPRPCSPLSRRSSISSNPFKKSLVVAVNGSGSPPSGLGVTKRKRPTRLDIPVLPVGFSEPDRPVHGVDVVEEERDGFYSVYCKKGRRSYMEDRFSVDVQINGDHKKAIFGVFDGHGGAKAAEFAAEKLNKNIMSEIEKNVNEGDIKEAVKHGYLKTDSDFLEGELHGGSCCVTALITNGDLIVSNAGDCRAVMSRGGVAEALTTDHRPSRPDEKARIEAKGGYVDCYNGVWRIQGSLAVSRGIGDRQLKQFVSAEPETRVLKISPNDEFLILASDGLWDKVTDQEAVDIAKDEALAQPLAACKKLVDMAVSKGTLDDVSVMIIPLKKYMQ